MNDGLLFANAAVKTKESGFFGTEKLGRLIDSDSLADAVRVLAEAGYGGGSIPDDPDDFERLLRDEENAVENFVRKSAPSDTGFECFWLERDYHNLKVLNKAERFGAETEGLLLAGGIESAEDLKEKIAAGGTGLNEYALKALNDIQTAAENGKLTPRLVDCAFDKAAYRDVADRISKRGIAPAVKEYFTARADLTNITSLARTLAIGAGYDFFADCFVDGGEIPEERFRRAFRENESPYQLLRLTKLRTEADHADSVAALEKIKDDYLMSLFTASRSDMFTVQPIMGYYLGKKTEIKMLRVALVCIKNGVPREEIRKRMRKLYA